MEIKKRKINYNILVSSKRVFEGLSGFTLPELMISAFILIVSFSGIMLSFARCMDLTELSKNSSNVIIIVESKMEEIKNTGFGQILATYNNTTFTDPSIDGIGVIYVDNINQDGTTNTDLVTVTISFCWAQKNGRIIGEDKNLDGQLSTAEKAAGDNDDIIDSIVQIVSAIYDK